MAPTLLRGGITPDGVIDILVADNLIEAIGNDITADQHTEIIDVSGKVVWPGLINTHHHLAQSILKGVPAGINAGLDNWLPAVPFSAWPHMTPETLYVAARIGFSELLRSGCTTCVDHHYLYSSGTDTAMEEAFFRAAEEVGIRLVLARGGATHAGSHAGQQAVKRTESLDECLTRLQDTVAKHHDPSPTAMTRVAVAPTSLAHSSTPEDLKHLARFAREHGLKMHSHLLEVARDESVIREQHGMSAIDYADSVEWLGDDVWFAHLVACDQEGIQKLGSHGTGVAHCPVSNLRLGSGVADIPAMENAGMQVSIGVDGSASAESGSMINELMQTWLVHRGQSGASATSVEQVLNWATETAANLLDLHTGRLEPGYAADLVVFDIDQPRFAGIWNKAEAPIICGEPVEVALIMIDGQVVASDGVIEGVLESELMKDAEKELQRLKSLM